MCLQASRIDKYPIRFQSLPTTTSGIQSRRKKERERERGGKERWTRGGWSITKTNDEEGVWRGVWRGCGVKEKKGSATKRRIGRRHDGSSPVICRQPATIGHIGWEGRQRTGISTCKTGTSVETNAVVNSGKPPLRPATRVTYPPWSMARSTLRRKLRPLLACEFMADYSTMPLSVPPRFYNYASVNEPSGSLFHPDFKRQFPVYKVESYSFRWSFLRRRMSEIVFGISRNFEKRF